MAVGLAGFLQEVSAANVGFCSIFGAAAVALGFVPLPKRPGRNPA